MFPIVGSLVPARCIAQLASFQGGVDGKTSPGAEATPLPPEQMRPPGPITLAGECTHCVALVPVWHALAVCMAGRLPNMWLWVFSITFACEISAGTVHSAPPEPLGGPLPVWFPCAAAPHCVQACATHTSGWPTAWAAHSWCRCATPACACAAWRRVERSAQRAPSRSEVRLKQPAQPLVRRWMHNSSSAFAWQQVFS